MVTAKFRLPADHAVDTLVNLLEAMYPNKIPTTPSTEAYWRLVGQRELIDTLRSLQAERDENILKDD